jgi:hypothetical protein
VFGDPSAGPDIETAIKFVTARLGWADRFQCHLAKRGTSVGSDTDQPTSLNSEMTRLSGLGEVAQPRTRPATLTFFNPASQDGWGKRRVSLLPTPSWGEGGRRCVASLRDDGQMRGDSGFGACGCPLPPLSGALLPVKTWGEEMRASLGGYGTSNRDAPANRDEPSAFAMTFAMSCL